MNSGRFALEAPRWSGCGPGGRGFEPRRSPLKKGLPSRGSWPGPAPPIGGRDGSAAGWIGCSVAVVSHNPSTGPVDRHSATIWNHPLGIGVPDVHVENRHRVRVVDAERLEHGTPLFVAVGDPLLGSCLMSMLLAFAVPNTIAGNCLSSPRSPKFRSIRATSPAGGISSEVSSSNTQPAKRSTRPIQRLTARFQCEDLEVATPGGCRYDPVGLMPVPAWSGPHRRLALE